eukprot:TRINITY_DN90914_c0_g1_i1.p1 TRINITY_DN90914_c0_g1~~TRINITY_DN90914_c0_g1_i1.p1  ORF type:complete len:515 (+),score=56.92 TRINITY_DN90914_c0_g1_i1:119-1663(+)
MVPGPSQCPLFMAAVVAACGVALIVFSSVWPASPATGDHDLSSEHLYERYIRALAELKRAGMTGGIDVIDYGDGLGLGVSQSMSEGSVLLRIPETLSLDTARTRSCTEEQTLVGRFVKDDSPADCQIERAVVSGVARGDISRLTGLITLLIMERRRGKTSGLPASQVAAAALDIFPDMSWMAENGLFAIDGEEFRIVSTGTSMESWQQAAVNETIRAREFAQKTLAAKLGSDVKLSMEEVRWAYLMLHAYGQWVEDDGMDEGLGMPSHILFLWPLFLARPTPEFQHGVQLRHDPEKHVYEVVTPRALRYGEEIHFVDRRLSDASALSYRGLQLIGQHRAHITFNVSGAARDAEAQQTLDRFGCGAQPLRLYLTAQKTVDPHFISCMRMLALASNASKLQRAEKAGWLDTWPDTGMVDRKTELQASELAVSALQGALQRLGSSNAEIRQRFGSDPLARRPTVRVRESESMILLGLLKSMKELQLVGSNEYLFEALKDSQPKSTKKSKKKDKAEKA